ncbi:MAG: hypothetical protein Q9176_004829 [Flavoplaca citrina]
MAAKRRDVLWSVDMRSAAPFLSSPCWFIEVVNRGSPVMFSQLFHLAIFLPPLLLDISAATTPASNSLALHVKDGSYRSLATTTPNGDPFQVLQGIKDPRVAIGNAWQFATWDRPFNQQPPLRPIDLDSVNLLLDLTIAKYATRPPDGIAAYGTVGPESFPALGHLDTRVTVKQWEPGERRTRIWIPKAPSRNGEIAYAAQM